MATSEVLPLLCASPRADGTAGIQLLEPLLQTVSVCVTLAGSDMKGLAYWLATLVHLLSGLQHANNARPTERITYHGIVEVSADEARRGPEQSLNYAIHSIHSLLLEAMYQVPCSAHERTKTNERTNSLTCATFTVSHDQGPHVHSTQGCVCATSIGGYRLRPGAHALCRGSSWSSSHQPHAGTNQHGDRDQPS